MKKVNFIITLFLIIILAFHGCSSPKERVREFELDDASGFVSLKNKKLFAFQDLLKEEETSDKQADIKTWKRSQIVPNTSRLMIGDKEELPCRGMQIKVRISGFRARVLIDYYFYNDRDRQYEGTFKLRLPDEASCYFFAFGKTVYTKEEIFDKESYFFKPEKSQQMEFEPEQIMSSREKTWEKPKEARMVPKEKAAFAYHETVRRRIDPALMEWSGPGIFSARVFPLEGKRLHRIVIGYDVNLLPVGKDYEFRLGLPLKISRKVVDISVDNLEKENASIGITPKIKPDRGNEKTFYRFDDPKTETILVRLKDPGTIFLTGKDKKTRNYFAVRFYPQIPEQAVRRSSKAGIFLVDTSLSANPDKFNIWLKLLKSILDNNRDSLKEFNVIFFNIENYFWKKGFVKNNSKNVKELMDFAGTLSLEGATDLASAVSKAVKQDNPDKTQNKKYDLFLLSDGSITWGEGDQHVLLKIIKTHLKGSLFAYRTGLSGTDTRLLGKLARESRGALFSIAGEAEIKKASTAHMFVPWRLLNIKVRGCKDLLLAGQPKTIYPGQNLLLSGRGNPQQESIELTVMDGKQKKLSLKIYPDQIIHSGLAVRSYGSTAVRFLEDFSTASEDYSKAYATHFRIVGKTCSLLMLESEEDYKRYNIKPDDNAYIIKKNTVTQVINKILKQIGDTLGNPKAAFLSWLKKNEDMPGTEFKVPKSLSIALQSMPAKAFLVKPKSLICKLRTWKGIPNKVKKQLKIKKTEYDIITSESKRRLKDYGPADALKAVSSLIENNPGDTVLIRDIGFSAMEWGLGGHAYHLFKRAAESRPYEPQTYHAMATILKEMGNNDLALAYYETGLAGKWDSRFGDFHQILVLDYLAFLRKINNNLIKTGVKEYATSRLQTLSKGSKLEKVDLIVTIMWNTDRTDVDLHVIEPNGEECYYKHKKTKIGGNITQDVTQGYGPEMYRLKKAIYGKYRIRAKYYSSDQSRAGTRTKVYATIYKNWGRENEEVIKKVVTLTKGKEMHDIAEIVFEQ